MSININMIISELHDLTDTRACNVLRTGLISGLNGITDDYLLNNYSPTKSHINSNIFYVLDKGRYLDGAYYVVEDDFGNYVCSAGWNMYAGDTALVLTRAYVSPAYRASYPMATYLLPRMIDACSRFDKVWITCNKYNKTIYEWFVRADSGKKSALFNNWPDIYSQFRPIGRMDIYNTDQYVVQLRK